MEKQTVIHRRATHGAGKPNGAVSSVFDTGFQAKPKRKVMQLDLEVLKIERGVPMPEVRTGTKLPWASLYAQMKKGDMVRLTKRQATSFLSWGKKAQAALAKRTLGPDAAGVWRTA